MAHTTTAQQGPDPYAALLIRLKAKQLVGRAGLTQSDRQDIEQELHLDVHRRLPKLDEGRAKRTTFIRHVVENRVATLLAERTAASRDYRRCEASLDEPLEGDDEDGTLGDTVDQERYLRRDGVAEGDDDRRRDLRLDLSAALEGLPPDLRDLAVQLKTASAPEVARRMGIPRRTFRDRISRIRAHCERVGLAIYAAPAATSADAPVGIQYGPHAAPTRRPL
jgi:RNA polymerase sigma-70 factor (ECF subfamily)